MPNNRIRPHSYIIVMKASDISWSLQLKAHIAVGKFSGISGDCPCQNPTDAVKELETETVLYISVTDGYRGLCCGVTSQ